ncbi:MAG: hypothetical protein JWN44_3921 [Myxococcales bacterium]|nr:hypothetical protein [Myxococcales bacterium]
MTLRVVLIAVVLLAARAAPAREPATAIAPVTTGQSAPPELQRAFSEELPRALRNAGFDLVPPNEVDMKIGERPEFLQCRAGGCLIEEAAFLRVARLALPRLDRAPDGNYTIGISLFDATQKRSVSDAVDRVATAAEVREKLNVMAAKLRTDLSRPGRLEVNAQPAAALTVDGEAKGSTPWSGELPAGDHVLALESGGARVERDVSVPPGATARVDIALTAPPPPPARRNPALRPLKWVTLVAGVAAVGAGAGLMVLDGRGSCSRPSGQLQCPDLYDTKTGGLVALAGGGALVVTSVVLFIVDRPRH